MSVYSVKGKGWRYDFTQKGKRCTKAWFKTKTEAKQAVADLAKSIGLEPIDMGGADRAIWLEGMAVLLISNGMGRLDPFNFHLRRYP